MKKIIAIASMITLATTPIFADQVKTKITVSQQGKGGADPGGGLVVNQNGQLKLFAEVGLIIDQAAKQMPVQKYPEYYDLKPETIAAVKTIEAKLNSIPWNGLYNFSYSVLGKRTTFISQLNADEKLYSKIKSDYAITLSRLYKKDLNKYNTALPAFSIADKGITVILPDFEKLTPERQALILIHEANMRNQFNSSETMADRLASVFAKDSVLYEISIANKIDDELKLKFYKTFVHNSKDLIANFQLARVEKMRNQPFLSSEINSVEMAILQYDIVYLFLDSYSYYRPVNMKLDPSLVQ